MALISTDPMQARFAALREQADRAIDLGEAALLVATEAYPGLDVDAYLQRLDALAEAARPAVQAARGRDQVTALCAHLFVRCAYRGNSNDYYDPRNSYLNDVLDRRLGIPITLAVLLIEVGRRLGLRLRGVCFPGHFLVRWDGEEPLFIDPYHGGEFLDESDCRALLERVSNGRIGFDARLLQPAPKRRVLMRILRNLKAIHVRRGDLHSALTTVDRLLVLGPRQPRELRDRGMLCYELGQFQRAVDDLSLYLIEAGVGAAALLVRARLAAATDRLYGA